MTSKDYNLLAGLLRQSLATLNGSDYAGHFSAGFTSAVTFMAVSLANECAKGNPRFDRKRFYKAAGLDGMAALSNNERME